jgi:hypothetical protein
MFKNLLLTVIPDAVPLDTFTGLSSPSKEAQVKREAAVQKVIKKMKKEKIYLNVNITKQTEPVAVEPAPAEVAPQKTIKPKLVSVRKTA